MHHRPSLKVKDFADAFASEMLHRGCLLERMKWGLVNRGAAAACHLLEASIPDINFV